MVFNMKEILIIFKTHLDIGFTDLSENVKKKYLEKFQKGLDKIQKQVYNMGVSGKDTNLKRVDVVQLDRTMDF